MRHKPGVSLTARCLGGATTERRCAGCGRPFTTTRKRDDQCGRCQRGLVQLPKWKP